MTGVRHYIICALFIATSVGCQSARLRRQETPPVTAAPATPEDAAATSAAVTPDGAAPAPLQPPPPPAVAAGTEEAQAELNKGKAEDDVHDLQIKLVDKNGKPVPPPKGPAAKKGGKEVTPVAVAEEGHEAHEKMMAAAGATAEKAEAIAEKHDEILAARKPGSVPAEKALGWLKNGNRRYVKGYLRKDGASAKDRARLVAGQKPHATVFSCSDSRVPPEIVLDQKLGEIYTVRVSGKVLNANTISSIEYAVQYLGTNLVVLMGHENCNASSDEVRKSILEQSKILRDAMATGDVKVVSALYHLDSGTIDWK